MHIRRSTQYDFWTKKYIVRAHEQKTRRKYERGLSPIGKAEPKKYSKTNLRLSLPDTPPICCGGKDAQHNLQQGGEILAHGREDEIINL